MVKNGYLKLKNGNLLYAKQREEELESNRDSATIAAEFFHWEDRESREVSLINKNVDFGACARAKPIESRVVRVSNNTKGKVTFVWINPSGEAG